MNRLLNIIRQAGFKKYLYNSSWLVGEKLLRLFSGLFVGVYVARYLGPENYGILNYAISFVALFAVIASLGLDEIVINELVQSTHLRNTILGTAFGLKIFGTLITICLILISFIFHFNESQINSYILIIALSYIFQPFYVIDFYFQSRVQAKFLVQANILSLIINSIIRLILVIINADLIYFVLVSILDTFIVAIGLLILYTKQNLRISDWNFNFSLAKNLLKSSWPLIFSGVVVMIYMRIDQIMLKEMVGFDKVGIYSAAVRISELWYFIPMAIGGSFFPALINAKIQDERIFLKRISLFLTFMVLISYIIIIPIICFSDDIIMLLYGEKYLEASQVLTISIWATTFVFIGTASGKYMVIENLTKSMFYRTFCGAIINVVMNLFLIPRYGMVGAAYSTLVAQAVAAYFYDVFDPKTRALFLMKTRAIFLIDILKSIRKLN